jgi:hypothetical protein
MYLQLHEPQVLILTQFYVPLKKFIIVSDFHNIQTLSQAFYHKMFSK